METNEKRHTYNYLHLHLQLDDWYYNFFYFKVNF